MKKLVLCSFIFLQAMVIRAQYSGLIISPGISISKPSFPDIGELGNKAVGRFDGGLGVEFALGKKISLQAEVNYSMQWLKVNADSMGGFIYFANDYLTIPLLAKFHVVSGLSVFAGPQFGWLLSSRIKISSLQGQGAADITWQLKSTDFYGVAGLEYRFPSGFFINARYHLGLTNIDKSFLNMIDPDAEWKNRYFAVRLGYSVPFKKLMKINQ